jgi:catechol 2,3-dioxygenase-like lactoylglutathione lyase family enzyme
MLIPIFKCKDIDESIAFYTKILDFELVSRWPETGFLAFAELNHGEDVLYLSTHSGDGAFGSVIAIPVESCDNVFKKLKSRGLDTSTKKESPVHQEPIDQSWGVREFYVTDPNGNTIRFMELK